MFVHTLGNVILFAARCCNNNRSSLSNKNTLNARCSAPVGVFELAINLCAFSLLSDPSTASRASTTRTNADDANADEGAGTGTAAPLDVDELGRASWALMHTIAAYYPQKPTHAQRVQARRFFDALGDLYPCATCRADLRADVDAHPPRCESREALAKWVCERHNVVNEKLGKEKHSCAIAELDKRWLKGPSTCWHG